MPSTFSRLDVEKWVPEPSSSRSEGGFVAKLFSCIYQAVTSLAGSRLITDTSTRQMYDNEVERLFLWGQGLDVIEGELDEVLSRSKELRTQVLDLFLRLGTAVLQGLSHGKEESLEALEQYQRLNSMVEATEAMIQDSKPDESTRPYTPMGSDVSVYGATEIMEEISVYIDCLLDLSSSLENPALDIQHEGFGERPNQPNERFDVSSEEALMYCRRIRDRFEALPKYLVERLAEANRLRAESIRALREVQPEMSKALPVHIPEDVTEDLFSSGHPLTKTTGSTVPYSIASSVSQSSSIHSSDPQPPSIFFSAPESSNDAHPSDDSASQATFASFSTSASAVAVGRPRVPPMPEAILDGWNTPPCLVCSGNIRHVRTRSEWKKHVFDDLEPYVCTVEGCEGSTAQFKRSRDWACHEQLHSPPGSTSEGGSAECLFCCGVYQFDSGAYYKHVSAHLREVSLFVLPQSLDEGEGMDSDGSDETDGSDVDLKKDFNSGGGGESTQARDSEPGADSIIERILELTSSKSICLGEEEIIWLCSEAREIFLAQPALLHCNAPLNVIGDIPGQYNDLLQILMFRGFPPKSNYLLVGSYVDDGDFSLEIICVLLALKIKHPNNIWLLRGNPDDLESHLKHFLSPNHAVHLAIIRRHSTIDLLFEAFLDVFNCMPFAAIVDDKIFCVDGGLSPDLESMEQIRQITRPTNTTLAKPMFLQNLLCARFDAKGDVKEKAGSPLTFGPNSVTRFLAKHDMCLAVTGSSCCTNGYHFYADRKLLTLTSSNLWGNLKAILSIDDNHFGTIYSKDTGEYRMVERFRLSDGVLIGGTDEVVRIGDDWWADRYLAGKGGELETRKAVGDGGGKEPFKKTFTVHANDTMHDGTGGG